MAFFGGYSGIVFVRCQCVKEEFETFFYRFGDVVTVPEREWDNSSRVEVSTHDQQKEGDPFESLGNIAEMLGTNPAASAYSQGPLRERRCVEFSMAISTFL